MQSPMMVLRQGLEMERATGRAMEMEMVTGVGKVMGMVVGWAVEVEGIPVEEHLGRMLRCRHHHLGRGTGQQLHQRQLQTDTPVVQVDYVKSR